MPTTVRPGECRTRTFICPLHDGCAVPWTRRLLCRARRGRKVLEERIIRDEDRIQVLEKELEVTILFGEEADRKYEEVDRPV